MAQQMLIRPKAELKAALVNEAKRIGITTNALVIIILDEWAKKMEMQPRNDSGEGE